MKPPVLDESLPIGPKEELPEAIQQYLDSISEQKEDIRVAVPSDMSLEGDFKDCWLVATDKRIFVVNGDHSQNPELVHEVPIADVNDVTLKNYIGNGILEVKTSKGFIELLRFSKTAFRENGIAEIPGAIDLLRERSGQKVEKRKGRGYG